MIVFNKNIVPCPVCGKQYEIYSMYVGDQSSCPECRNNKDESKKWPVPDNKPMLEAYDGEE